MSSIATTVECGGQRHQVIWQGGELLIPDHTHAERERIVAALGETTCACVDVADAWSRHCDDPAVLTVLTRGPAETIIGTGRQGGIRRAYAPLQRVRPGVGGRRTAASAGGLGAPAEHPPDDLEVLYGLGPALGARLVAAVTAQCLAQVAAGDVSTLPALRVSLATRAGLALTMWTNGARPVRVEVAGEAEAPSLRADGDELVAVLGLSWVADVWGQGVATVGDCFVIDAREGESGELLLSGVGPDLGETTTMTVRFGEP